MIETVLTHLKSLVGIDTQNPPRDIREDGPLVEYLWTHLPGFEIEVYDFGDGCLAIHARRGSPRRLFNFHVDTVPAAEGYSADPFELRIDESQGRAIGLGACDIKGASACMLAAVEQGSPTDLALLFTTDEEAGSSTCVRQFCQQDWDYDEVIVAEPTMAKAVLEHRGIMTATARFKGVPGHSSERRALEDNALHRATRWAARALEYAVEQESTTYGPLSGIRFNLGKIDGGKKPNMIAGESSIWFGFRPLPGQDGQAILDELWQGMSEEHELAPGFVAPSLPHYTREAARQLADSMGVEVAQPVDFWTEAALFSEAGFDSLVFGPGDIPQAHTADEWVSLEQLQKVTRAYLDWF